MNLAFYPKEYYENHGNYVMCKNTPIDTESSRGPRKRPKMGGMGKSGFDSLSYAELYEEHDWHLIFDVWWPHDE